MTTSNAVNFHIVGAGSRRSVAVSPASRPDLRLLLARPRRRVAPGRVGAVTSCVAARPAVRAPWLRWKVAAVGALVVFGTAVAVPQYVAMLDTSHPDPALGYVAGDPAWAHVTQP